MSYKKSISSSIQIYSLQLAYVPNTHTAEWEEGLGCLPLKNRE